MNDPWFDLRQNLFGNVEPYVEMEAMTEPLIPYGSEEIPARSAGVSYGSRDKLDTNRIKSLTHSLLERGHFTPFESVQYNFLITGISKACGSQLSRHRIGGGHISKSRRFVEQNAYFVYPTLDYIDNKSIVESILKRIEEQHISAFEAYTCIRKKGAHKEDARRVIPVSTATERAWWINVRALRDFLRLRLAADAEWEIRRLAGMLLTKVREFHPSFYEDFK